LKELWLIRHGQTDWNADGRIQGSTDVPLNAMGLAQARALVPGLEDVAFDAVYASDLGRAWTTCVTSLPKAVPRSDARLRELAYGVLEGNRWSELTGDLASAARVWLEDPSARRIDGGESYADVRDRMRGFIDDLPERGRFAAFTHGGTILNTLYGIVGEPNGTAWRFEIDNCSVTRLRFDRRGATILSVNERV